MNNRNGRPLWAAFVAVTYHMGMVDARALDANLSPVADARVRCACVLSLYTEAASKLRSP